jgi:hypothetical protein
MKTLRRLFLLLAAALALRASAESDSQTVNVTLTLGSQGTFGGEPPEGYCALAVAPPPRARGTFTQELVQQSTVNGPLQILGGQVTVLKATTADQGTWVMTYVPTGIGPNESSITVRYDVVVAKVKPALAPAPAPKKKPAAGPAAGT